MNTAVANRNGQPKSDSGKEWNALPAAKPAFRKETKPTARRDWQQKPPASSVDPKTTPADGERQEHPILFQKYFKSVGTRTYVAQMKVATNGNHYLVFTEASRVKGTDDLRKTRIFVYSEDFKAFFDMLSETLRFTVEHPVPKAIADERAAFWRKVNSRRKR